MSLNFSFFGEPQVTKDGEAVQLPFKKAEALLFFLASEGGAPKEKIAFLLWGDKNEKQAAGSLRNALCLLRRNFPENIVANKKEIRLADFTRDADVIDRLASRAEPLPEAIFSEPLSGLDMLDRHLNMKQEYDNRKQARIDSLRLQLQAPGNDSLCSALCSIGKEYETFISDSALVFYDRALHAAKSMHDNTLMTKAELGRIKVLGIMGFFHEAMIELDSIEQNGIPPSLEREWLDCGRQLYSYIEAYTVQSKNENMNPYLDKYVERQNYYRQKLLKLLTPGTIQLRI